MTLMPVSKISTFVDCSWKLGGSRWMGIFFFAATGPASSTGSPITFKATPEALEADGHRGGAARVAHGHAAHEAVRRVHRDGAHGALAEVLSDLEGEVVLAVRDAGVRHLERVEDLRQLVGPWNSMSTAGPMTWTTLPADVSKEDCVMAGRAFSTWCAHFE